MNLQRSSAPTARRRLPAIVALGALLTLTSHAAAGEVAEVTGAATARASASPSARALGSTTRGHAYAVVRTSGDWVEVQFDHRTAWLRRSDLTVRDGAVKRATAASGLRVRSGAGANHRSIGTLPTGARVADRGGSAAWRKISFGGRDGWVSARFLAAAPDEGASSRGLAAVIDDTDADADPSEPVDADGDEPESEPAAHHEAPATPASTTHMAWQGGRRLGAIDAVVIDGKPVAVRTADAYKRMRDAARRDGVTLRINSGFRSYEEQAALYKLYRQGRGNLAAKPGYSNHQNGRALDLNTSDPGVYRWLSRNARHFGFRRTVPSEKWHWELR